MYLALARKYRPQRFAELIGQSHITRTLQNAIAVNKLYSAMIFSGMKGVGKTSTARILAKAINCKQGPAVEPCNQCEFCLEITQDSSADYLEIDGASNNGVEEVRNLRETVKYKPIKNRFRVIVIDEVHMLTNAAWNALLKTIEEPPEHTYFILATTDFHKIPATIVSRCQHFEFRRIPLTVIKQVLEEINRQEGITVSDYGLRLIARAADGSLRDAKKILDQAIAISGSSVSDQDILEILGIIEEQLFLRVFQAIIMRDRASIIEIISQLVERGIDARFFYLEFLKFFRDAMILKVYPQQQKLVSISPENIEKIADLLKKHSELELIRFFNMLREMEPAIKNSEFPVVLLEFLLLKLTYLSEIIPLEELIAQIQQGGNFSLPQLNVQKKDALPENNPLKTQEISRPETEKTESFLKPEDVKKTADSSPVQGDPKVCVQDVLAAWKEQLQKDYPRFQGIFDLGQVYFKDDLLVIEIGDDGILLVEDLKEKKGELQKMLSEICKREIKIELVVQKKGGSQKVPEKKEVAVDQNVKDLLKRVAGKIEIIENSEEE